MPYKAKLLFREKVSYDDGAIIEMRAWTVPRSERTPEGLKYSMVYIDTAGTRRLGYDNSDGKGHHKHEGEIEMAVQFDSLEKLRDVFLAEIPVIRGEKE